MASPKAEPAAKLTPCQATPDELSEIASRLWTTIEESSQPVSAGLLASRLRQEHPDIMENWNGLGSFKLFFRSLRLSRLLWLSGSGGRVLDPSRHELDGTLPEQDPESPWSGAEEIFPVIREVCVLTGAPLLAPRDLEALISSLVQVLRSQEFKLASTAQSVSRQCVEAEGLRVRPKDVNFVIRGMQMNGHVFGQGADDKASLITRLFNQVLFLCEREQKMLDPTELRDIRTWIGCPATA